MSKQWRNKTEGGIFQILEEKKNIRDSNKDEIQL